MKDLLGATILIPAAFVAIGIFGADDIWAGSSNSLRGAPGTAEPRHNPRDASSSLAPPNLIMRPVVAVPIPTPTPAGRWVFYKSGGVTFYKETGNLTALGDPYITGPEDALAAVDRGDRWLLRKWLLLVWDGGEAVVWAGDICGECAAYDVAVDLSPGLYDRLKRRGMTGQVEVYYWEGG